MNPTFLMFLIVIWPTCCLEKDMLVPPSISFLLHVNFAKSHVQNLMIFFLSTTYHIANPAHTVGMMSDYVNLLSVW